MRKAGAIAAEVLLHVGEKVTPGITTDKLDQIAHDEIVRLGAYPSPLNYRGFPNPFVPPLMKSFAMAFPTADNYKMATSLTLT